MASGETKKKILIIDDSELDRTILKSILENDYDVVEAKEGFMGIEYMMNPEEQIDLIMLDVQMPDVDGFAVMKMMRILNIEKPVVLITAEATKDNVQKAARLNACSFMSKPFHRELIQNKVADIMSKYAASGGMAFSLSAAETPQTQSSDDIIAEVIYSLETLVKNRLKVHKANDAAYQRISQLVKLFLEAYAKKNPDDGITEDDIAYASKAAYFCDIGFAFVNDTLEAEDMSKLGWQEKMYYKSHPTMGAEIISLAAGKGADAFVDICMDMCQNHHERCDGKGYPRALREESLSVYAQVCAMAVNFDKLATDKKAQGSNIFDAINEFEKGIGDYSMKMYDAFGACHDKLANMYA